MPAKGSGIHTLADLQKRCMVSDITECWCWLGALYEGQARVWIYDRMKGKSAAVSGPRATARLAGKKLLRGWKCWNSCRCQGCMNPDHVKTGTVAEWGAWVAENGQMKGSLRRMAAARRRWVEEAPQRAALAAEGRGSREKGVTLAARYGESPQTISKMRAGKSWSRAASPFDGLGERLSAR